LRRAAATRPAILRLVRGMVPALVIGMTTLSR
jgi:hypothetical protein